MPVFLPMRERFNDRFRHEKVGAIDVRALAHPTTLPELASALGIATNDMERAFLSTWPPGLQQMLRALLEYAVEQRKPVAVMWAPGYDFELQAWEERNSATPGGITVLLRGRYPGD